MADKPTSDKAISKPLDRGKVLAWASENKDCGSFCEPKREIAVISYDELVEAINSGRLDYEEGE